MAISSLLPSLILPVSPHPEPATTIFKTTSNRRAVYNSPQSVLRATFVCEMSNPLQTTPYAPSPTHYIEESPSVPEEKILLPSLFSRPVSALKTASHAPLPTHDAKGLPSAPEKKTLLSSIFSWPGYLLKNYPFLSSIIASVVLSGSVAGIVWRSYYSDKFADFSTTDTGVSGVTFSVWTDTMYHRSHSLALLTG